MKAHTRSRLPPNHPTLSQDLTMKLSSSPLKSKGKYEGQNSKANELGFLESWQPSIPSSVYMEAPKRLNYPY
jgi:hypothetical protein